jgi:hypothetical protein
MNAVTGSCLCGEVKFECDDAFDFFHLCHCTQCQKTTGSAHVSNLFTDNDNISWISGEENILRYDVPGRTLTSAFCGKCGSPVPYLSKSGKSLVVPAGSLDKAPSIVPQDNIFWSERASWYEEGVKSKKYDGFPE